VEKHWRNYFRLGINHHLLFPASFESADVHEATLPRVLSMPEFEVVDLFILEGGEREKRLTEMILSGGKEVVYNCPLMTGPGLNPHSPDRETVRCTKELLRVHLDRAKAVKAKFAVIASGVDPGADQREEHTERFVDYVAEACAYAAEGQPLQLVIEPFDRGIGKNLLIGPSAEALRVVEEVRKRGHSNIGILLDMGHVPIMEESFEQAVSTLGPHIRHVHLGNCVKKNPADPLYGDMHPPWGYPGGENDVEETAEFLKCLFAAGFLGEGRRPTVTFEMRPYAGLTEEESVRIFLEKLDKAWEIVWRDEA